MSILPHFCLLCLISLWASTLDRQLSLIQAVPSFPSICSVPVISKKFLVQFVLELGQDLVLFQLSCCDCELRDLASGVTTWDFDLTQWYCTFFSNCWKPSGNVAQHFCEQLEVKFFILCFCSDLRYLQRSLSQHYLLFIVSPDFFTLSFLMNYFQSICSNLVFFLCYQLNYF